MDPARGRSRQGYPGVILCGYRPVETPTAHHVVNRSEAGWATTGRTSATSSSTSSRSSASRTASVPGPSRTPTRRPPAPCWARSRRWRRGRWPTPTSPATATRCASTRRPTPPTSTRASRSRSTRCGTASGGGSRPTTRSAAWASRPPVQWAAGEMILGANAPVFMYMAGPNFASVVYRNGTEQQKHWAQLMVDRGWGATMVLTEPDAGSDVGAGRTKARDNGDGTWSIEGVKRFITSGDAGDLNENIMHLVLARPEGARAGHQGPVAVPRPQVPLRPRDRRAGRAQRRLRHERRAQDGPQRLGDLRGHLRRQRRPGHRLAARRGPRRHRPDVPGHRVRPDDGRHQGHRHALDGLPAGAGVREGAHPGRRPHAPDEQDRPARADHQPPRRAPQPDAAEGVRRGPARRLHLHVDLPGRDPLR